MGNSFLRLTLECLYVWGHIFVNSPFQTKLEELISDGVKFVDYLNYYKEWTI